MNLIYNRLVTFLLLMLLNGLLFAQWQFNQQSSSVWTHPGFSNPKVGIGTTTPDFNLTIEPELGNGIGILNPTSGNWRCALQISSADFGELYLADANNVKQVQISAAQDNWFMTNVGIGTITPNFSLTIEPELGEGIGILNPDNSNWRCALQISSADFGELFLADDSNVKQVQVSAGADNWFLSKVGVGTNSPEDELHVVGTARVDAIRFPDGSVQTTAYAPVGSSSPGASNIAALERMIVEQQKHIQVLHDALTSTVAALRNENIHLDMPLEFASNEINEHVDTSVLESTANLNGDDLREFTLAHNYPDPFNPATTISYTLPEMEYVELSVYDMLGQLVTTLVNGVNAAGTHSVKWNGTNHLGERVGSGTYIYTMKAGEFTKSEKMIYLR